MVDTRSRSSGRAAWLTVERAAYVALGLLAAVLRLANLGLRPLTDGEAAQALAAFNFIHGTAGSAPAGTIPALFTGNAVVFTLFGVGDGLARWLPVLAGVVLVLLPYGLRHRLGRGGALAASLFLAISPSAIYFSRAVDGAMIAAAAGLAVVVGLFGYVDTRRPLGLYAAAVALGLGLCASPAMVSLALILAVYGLWQYVAGRWLHRPVAWTALAAAWQDARSQPGLLARVGITLAATFGLVATALVLHPAGLGLAADLLGAWLRGFLPEPEGQPLLYMLLLLLRYEALALLLGVGEAVRWAVSRRHDASGLDHTGLLVFWAAAAVLLVLVSGHRPPSNVLLAVLPLALLAGQGVEHAWHWIGRRESWAEVALVAAAALGIAVFTYLQLAAYSLTTGGGTVALAGIDVPITTGHLLLSLLALVLLAAVASGAVYARGPALAVSGGWLVLVVLLLAFDVKTLSWANYIRPADPRELLALRPIAPDVRLLRSELETLSQTLTGDPHALPVTVESATGPAVAWYLRDFERQTVVDSLATQPATADMRAAVTLAAQDLPIGETYRGQGFPLRTAWQPYSLNAQAWVRWIMFGDAWPATVEQQVVLWTKESE